MPRKIYANQNSVAPERHIRVGNRSRPEPSGDAVSESSLSVSEGARSSSSVRTEATAAPEMKRPAWGQGPGGKDPKDAIVSPVSVKTKVWNRGSHSSMPEFDESDSAQVRHSRYQSSSICYSVLRITCMH